MECICPNGPRVTHWIAVQPRWKLVRNRAERRDAERIGLPVQVVEIHTQRCVEVNQRAEADVGASWGDSG